MSKYISGLASDRELITIIKKLARDKRHDNCSCSLSMEIITLLKEARR